jgi:hypothetical protein
MQLESSDESLACWVALQSTPSSGICATAEGRDIVSAANGSTAVEDNGGTDELHRLRGRPGVQSGPCARGFRRRAQRVEWLASTSSSRVEEVGSRTRKPVR